MVSASFLLLYSNFRSKDLKLFPETESRQRQECHQHWDDHTSQLNTNTQLLQSNIAPGISSQSSPFQLLLGFSITFAIISTYSSPLSSFINRAKGLHTSLLVVHLDSQFFVKPLRNSKCS